MASETDLFLFLWENGHGCKTFFQVSLHQFLGAAHRFRELNLEHSSNHVAFEAFRQLQDGQVRRCVSSSNHPRSISHAIATERC